MRGFRITALASVVILGAYVGQAVAEASLNEILRDYDDPKATAAQRIMISSNLSSIEVGLGWANTLLRVQRMQAGLYCPPDKMEITPQQLMDILRGTLKDEPRLGDRPIGFAVLASLQRAFPCK